MTRVRSIGGFKVNKVRCETCPFSDGGCLPVRAKVEQRAMTEGSQMCHSTDNKTLCRGARDFQIQMFFRMGFLKEESDKCWEETWKKQSSAR